jgi:uncharacterized membrane protein YadS
MLVVPYFDTQGGNATLVKLMRVAMLLPVIVVAVMVTRLGIGGLDGDASGKRPPLLPGFVVAFAALVAVNSLGWIPQPAIARGNEVSRWSLVAAIAGIGMKTQLRDLSRVGIKPVLLMIGETVFLAALVLLLLRWG